MRTSTTSVALEPVTKMNRQLRVLKGLHHDASVALTGQERHLVGSDAQCSVVLCDPGVAPRHCVIASDDYGLTCRAIDAPLSIGGRQIKPGETASLEDFALIQCGTATLGVGPAEGDWSSAFRAMQAQAAKPRSPVRSLQRLNPYAQFAVVIVGIAAVIGAAYAALSSGEAGQSTGRVEAARHWLATVAPPNSELAIGTDLAPERDLLLSGYVLATQEMETLRKASKSFRDDLRLQVYSVQDMLAELSRQAQLAGTDCAPVYKSAGRMGCSKAVANERIAAKLRTAARDVPGLRSLDLSVDAPPVVAASVPAAPVARVGDDRPMRLTRKFAVFMFRNQRYLIGPHGERYREGDEFDGFTIEHIEIDQVTFARDGRQFQFHVASMRTAAAG